MWNKIKNVGMAVKAVLLFIAFGMVPMVIIGLVANNSLNVSEQSVVDRFGNTALGIADKIDRSIAERFKDIQTFTADRALQDRTQWYEASPEESAIVRAMNRYVRTHEFYRLMILVDTDGRVIAVNSRDGHGNPISTEAIYEKSYRDADWFRALASGRYTARNRFHAGETEVSAGVYAEDVHVDDDVRSAYPGDDGLTLGFSAPVYDDQGRVIAYWSTRTSFELVESIYVDSYEEQKEAGYPNIELTLLDREGRIIVDYDPAISGTTEVQHDMDVLMRFNLADQGVTAAQKAVAGRTGADVAFHALCANVAETPTGPENSV